MTNEEIIKNEIERLSKPETIQLDQHCVSIEIRTSPNLLAACKVMAEALDSECSCSENLDEHDFIGRMPEKCPACKALSDCAKLLSRSEGE